MGEQTTISDVLQSEHRRIDEDLDRFRRGMDSGRVDPGPFEAAAETLRRHIYLEEDILFPQVEARGMTGPTEVMAQEHGEICHLLDIIHDLIQTGAGPQRIRAAFVALHRLLEEHNLKEEQVLYPSSDQMLGKDEVARVLQRLIDAKPPEGWECRAHHEQS